MLHYYERVFKKHKIKFIIINIVAISFFALLYVQSFAHNYPQHLLNYKQKYFSRKVINYNLKFETLETVNYSDIPAEALDRKSQFFGLIYKNTYGLPTSYTGDRKRFYGDLSKNLPTWKSFMPDVASSLKIMDDYNPNRNQPLFTSSRSNVIFFKPRIYEVGETFFAQIQARDFHGQPKSFGGDYFRARLMKVPSNNPKLSEGIPCHVQDHSNGTYSLSAPLPAEGTFRLEVLLCASIEAIDSYVKWADGRKHQGYMLATELESNESVLCNSDLIEYDKLKDEKICNYSNPRNGEPYFCTSPLSGKCFPIKHTPVVAISGVIDSSFLNYPHNIASDLRVSFKSYQEISGSRVEIIVKPNLNSKIPLFSEMTEMSSVKKSAIKRPTGYSFNGRWMSLVSNYKANSLAGLTKCFSNKIVYLLGDSTMRQFFLILMEPFNLDVTVKDQEFYYHVPRIGVNKQLNITIYYRAHGPPIRNPSPPSINPYMTDAIDAINTSGGDDLVIVLNLGLHYVEYNPIILIHRLVGIKKALIRHSEKHPETKIIIKGMNVSNISSLPFEWLILRYDRLLKEIFKDLKNSVFIDLWDLTTLWPLSVDYHPNGEILTEQALLIFNYICS